VKVAERTTLPIDQLESATYNPRKISAENLQGLEQSLKRFGVVQDVVVNRREDGTYRIVGGHQRVTALKHAKAKDVPVTIVELSDTEEKSLNLILNSPKVAGTFVDDDLQNLLQELEIADPDLFADTNLDDLLKKENTKVPDYVSKFELLVEVEGEEDQQACFELLKANGYENVKVLTL
jgi:ParB/RepB/Spo0J family partition protein